MKTNLEKLEKCQTKLSVVVEPEEWKNAQQKEFKKLADQTTVPGFRKGHAPENLVKTKVNHAEVLRRAADAMIDVAYKNAIKEHQLKPYYQPELNIVKMDDDQFEFDITFIGAPTVKLGGYKDIEVKKDKVKVTKEEVDHEVSHILDRYAELVSKDGKAEEGDTVVIDFKGFKDNEEFEGGSAEGYSLELGSHSFIPGFEEGVVGMKREESKDIELTFPEDYMAKELAGQKVVFNVIVHDIKKRVIPDLDEEFFKDLDMEGVSNKEELEKVVEEEIKAQKEREADNKFIEDLLEKASKNMKVEIDEEIIDAETDRMYKNFIEKLKMQGVTEELYFAYSGAKKEDIMKDMKKEAEKRVAYRYLLEAIVKAEEITISDKDAKDEVKKMADMYKMTEEDIMKELGSLEVVKYDLAMQKAIELLKENN